MSHLSDDAHSPDSEDWRTGRLEEQRWPSSDPRALEPSSPSDAYLIVTCNREARFFDAYRAAGAREIILGVPRRNMADHQGRATNLVADLARLDDQCHRARQADLDISIGLYEACSGNRELTDAGMTEIVELARLMASHQIRRVTLNQPFLTNLLRRLLPNTHIRIGVGYDCQTMGQFELLLDYLNVNAVVVSPLINKHFKLLRRIIERWGPERLEITCTEACLMGCPYRTWHTSYLAHQDDGPTLLGRPQIPPCSADRLHRKHSAVSAMFVRREDLSFYQKLGIQRFHIGCARHEEYETIKTLRYYRGAMPLRYVPQAIRGELALFERFDLAALDGYYDYFFNESCPGTRYNCTDCDHCGSYADRVLAPGLLLAALPEPQVFFQKMYFSNYVRELEALIMSEASDASGAPDNPPPDIPTAPDRPDPKDQARAWKSPFTLFQWVQVPPPWIPSEAECDTFARLIQPSNPPTLQAALLGPTFQLRHILAGHQARVDIIDFSVAMYHLTRQLCPDQTREAFHESEWGQFFSRQSSDSYHLILGDLILRLLSDEQARNLLHHAARTLKKEGRLILRLHVAGSETPPPFDTRLADLVEWAATSALDTLHLRETLFFHLSELFVLPDKRLDLERMQQVLESLCQNATDWRVPAALHPVIESCRMTPFTIYVRTPSQLAQLIRPYFTELAAYPYTCDNYPEISIRVFGVDYKKRYCIRS